MKKVKNSELLLSYIREGRSLTNREKLALITQLSIPSILAQISATVMFFIDASMVGHLGAKASAAIGLVESTSWLMGGLASAANMGFSVHLFCHLRLLRYLLPDGRTGRIDAEVLWQHEDSIHP